MRYPSSVPSVRLPPRIIFPPESPRRTISAESHCDVLGCWTGILVAAAYNDRPVSQDAARENRAVPRCERGMTVAERDDASVSSTASGVSARIAAMLPPLVWLRRYER